MTGWIFSLIRRFQPAPEFTCWDDYFTGHEVLSWEGRPVKNIYWSWTMIGLMVFGLPFLATGLGCAGYGIAQIMQITATGDVLGGFLVILFGLPFLAIGLGLTIGIWLVMLLRPYFTRYALTNKHAYVMTSWWSQNIESYPVRDTPYIAWDRAKTDCVYFTKITERDSEGDYHTTRVGFENIADGAAVHALLRDIQQKAIQ